MSKVELKKDNTEINEREFEEEESLGGEYKDNETNNEPDIYPDATVNIVPESTSVFQLKRKYDKNPPLLKLDPDFQRSSVWNAKQQSELIESILMGIPLPLIYVKENKDGVYIIVDGRQRLTTLFNFMDNKFKLKGLKILNELNGNYFNSIDSDGVKYSKHLSPAQQSKVEDCQFTLHVIKPPTQDRVTFDLFDRVNRGGTRLNNQEMRNAIYQGESTLFLKKLSELDSFKLATERSIKPDRMKDKYLILRMVAFYLLRKKELISIKDANSPVIEYKSDLEDLLGKTMEFLNSPEGAEFRQTFPLRFDKAMKGCFEILGTGCFRKPGKLNGPRRPISMYLFETISYLVLELIEHNIPEKEIKLSFERLTRDEVFEKNTGYAVDSSNSVKLRFDCVEKIIAETIYA